MNIWPIPLRLKPTLLLVSAAIAVAALLQAHALMSTAQAQAASAPVQQVDVARARYQTVVDWQEFSGRLQAVESVEVRPQVAGRLTQVHFHDGATVRRGDVLFTIDPRPYQAELAKAQAQLAAGRARAEYTTLQFKRAEALYAENAIAKSDYDDRQNAAREAAAGMDSASAQVDAARLNLAYTRVLAPIDGRVSRAEITVGNVVEPGLGAPAMTTLVSTNAVYAAADVDEQSYLKYVSAAQRSGNAVTVLLGLADEPGFPRRGKLSSVDNRMDVSSGTIRLRASFDNHDGKLVPGLYARLRFGGVAHGAVLVDDQAIGTDQDKRFVYVVDAHDKVSYREVHTGAMAEAGRVVERGLRADERVVVNGSQLVKAGDTVRTHEVGRAKTQQLSSASDAAKGGQP